MSKNQVATSAQTTRFDQNSDEPSSVQGIEDSVPDLVRQFLPEYVEPATYEEARSGIDFTELKALANVAAAVHAAMHAVTFASEHLLADEFWTLHYRQSFVEAAIAFLENAGLCVDRDESAV